MNYVCFGNRTSFSVLDKVNKKYVTVIDGNLKDETTDIEKMYKRYWSNVKSGKFPETKMGVLFYGYLNNEKELRDCLIYDSDIRFQTDDRGELNEYIIKEQIRQLEFKANYLKVYTTKCKEYVGLYTYGGK